MVLIDTQSDVAEEDEQKYFVHFFLKKETGRANGVLYLV